jgi:2,4-dichlorophenol 6-monooxygenase
MVCVRPWNEWNLVARYDKAQGEPDLSDDAMRALAHELIGDRDVRVEIKSARTWQVARSLAKQLRRGRVFLVGDAAHRHPPNNGLGTNTAIQDSYNLAWKLALVLRGEADESLLDSYPAERAPVAKTVVGRAFRSMLAMNEVGRAIALGEGLERALQLQHYQFNCHGVELGQFYASDAVLGDGREEADPPERDPLLYHRPSTVPGAVLPHAWIEQDGRALSTLDLVGHGGFSLLTGTAFELWHREAAAAQRGLGVPIAVCAVADWAPFAGVDPAGCLLVRPDRHIAWSAQRLTHEGALLSALASILGCAVPGPAAESSAYEY